MDEAATPDFRLTGTLCVVFVLIFLFMVSQELSYEDADNSGPALVIFLGDHQTEAKIEVVAQGIVVAIWATLTPLLYRLLRTAERTLRTGWSGVALAGGLGTAVFVGAAVAIQRALVTGVDDADPAANAFLLLQHLSDGLFVLATLMVGLFLLGSGMVAVRTRLVWRWLGWVALSAAAANFVGAVLGLVGSAEEGAAGALAFLGQVAWLLFVLLLGVRLLRPRFDSPLPE